jgi:CRISPR-associated exonuclease Cas4
MIKEFSIVDLLYSWKVGEAKKKLEEKLDNEIFVTDLIYCPLKYRYQKVYKELAIGSAFNPITLYGEVIHQGLEKILSTLFSISDANIEVEYEKNILIDNNTYVIKGRIDVLINDYIIEIKSSSLDKNLPQAHHILQTRIYLWLANLDKALLVYITPNRIVEYYIREAISDGELMDLVRSIITGQPAPRYPWECKYCIYAILCPSKKTSLQS